MADALWIREADVVEMMHLGEAIDALEAGLRVEAEGGARNMIKTQLLWGEGNTLHAIGATVDGAGFVGTKTWAHTTGGATPLLILWDSESGCLKAVIEAFALGQMRTGAMSGVATRWLAAAQADELAIIGTGKQATAQVAAVAAVRPLKQVRVYSPTPEKRQAFAERLAEMGFPFQVRVAQSIEEAVDGARIVTLATRARDPFLNSAMLARGAHVNAIGAIGPERAEFAQDLFARCDRVAADCVPAVRNLSREFMEQFGEDGAKWADVTPISAVVAKRETRLADDDLTLFKAMGMGISDLALGLALFRRAEASGRGRPAPQPQRIPPRLMA
ncbi:MAG: NAD(P)-binding domain-containing protein [Alphaproteobacteria bacterium]|nr:NAD(P)-binding domain-containing protein [Alphaproteobacteria bacterium]